MTAAGTPVRLGLMPPLTGVVGMYGEEIERAARIACAEVNAAGGVLGTTLELCVEDDGSQPQSAVAAARRLVQERDCVALVGNLLSNSRIAVAQEVASRLQLPYLNFSFYEGSIRNRYFFHFAALPNQQIAALVPWLCARHGPKFFFAGHNYEWPRGSVDAAKRCLLAQGGEVLGEVYHDFGIGERQIESLLQAVARSGADVFMPFFAGDEQLAVLRRFSELGLHGRLALATCHFDEVMASRLAPGLGAGCYSCNSYFMAVDTAANRDCLDRLAHWPGVDGLWPQGNGVLSNFGEGAYLCVKAYAQALNQAGSLQLEAVLAALRGVQVQGPQGPVRMDPSSQHAWINIYLARCNEHGAFELVERFGQREPQLPERYAGMVALRSDEPAEVAAAAPQAASILAIAEAAIIACDPEGRILEANAAACELFGYGEHELPGRSLHELLPPHLRAQHGEHLRRFLAAPERARGMHERGELMGYRRDGSFVPLEASIAKLPSARGISLVATLRDISRRKQMQDELAWQAGHDQLTGLPNRRLIRERLEQALQRSQRQQRQLALLFIDLDGFKLINDTYGHTVGDALLRQVAERLLQQVRPGDTVGRLSGDEFVVICEQLTEEALAIELAERISLALREAFVLDRLPVFLSASTGVALGHGELHDAEQLLRAADTAMYEAKSRAPGGWRMYSDVLLERARQRIAITQGLHGVIERDELSLRLQPIVEMPGGQVVAAELLLRWTAASGEIAPGLFIPIAEITGAIVPIGAWVFQRACEIEVAWRRRWGVELPRYIAVNLSTRQLAKPDLDQDFARILQATGARPERLLLEITETSLMADVETNLGVVQRLAALGLRIAVDDFGTGYSSLAQLTRMPVSVLKVDRAFVGGAEHKPENRAVIRAIIGLGRALGMTLVAEGVETQAQLDEVREQGCELIQGYLFHRPLAQEEIERLLDAERPARVAPQASPAG